MPRLTELSRLHLIIAGRQSEMVRLEILNEVRAKEETFPIVGLTIGSLDRSKPTLGLFGGVHGLERVGTHVVLAYLETLLEQLSWDKNLRELFSQVRIVSIPIVNPGGMYLGRRSNPKGVDLNRNAPVDAVTRPPWLAGGHRVGPWLPWYRGAEGQPMEVEAQTLVDFVQREMFSSQMSLAIDFHSGFGLTDRLWYPYAKEIGSFPAEKQAKALKSLLDRTFPYHVYQVEPQAINYTQHGDLWDHLFGLHHLRVSPKGPVFLPWTLEMGSWQWVKKNPKQIFSALGPFNPIKPHRYKRIMRRHLPLIDFFLKATLNHGSWNEN